MSKDTTNQPRRQAIAHCERFDILIETDVDHAMEEANEAISVDPAYDKGYACRARANQLKAQAFLDKEDMEMACESYAKCINDHIQCFELSKEHAQLCHAVIMAVNQDLTHLLKLEEKLKKRSECLKIITSMSTSPEFVHWECKHLNYLVKKGHMLGSGIAATLSCDLSSISWDQLLQKQDLDTETVQAIISLGGKFNLEEIAPKVSDNSIAILQQGIKQHSVKLFIQAVECSKFKKAEGYLKGKSQLSITDINLSEIIEAMVKGKIHSLKRICFVKKLLEDGIDPNSKREGVCPLDYVLELSSQYYQAERIELLTLLIKYNADIECCTYPRKKSTTLLHIATSLAIESEMAIELLQLVCKIFPYGNYEEGIIRDNMGNTPYHIVMEPKKSPNNTKICHILSQYPINPVANYEGKTPGAGRTKQDERYSILKEVTARFEKESMKSDKTTKKKKSKSKKELQVRATLTSVPEEQVVHQVQDTTSKPQAAATAVNVDISEIESDVKEFLSQLSSKPPSYFEPLQKTELASANPTAIQKSSYCSDSPLHDDSKENHVSGVAELDPNSAAMHASEHEVNLVEIGKNFDKCSWEIECTDKVKKFFANIKIPTHEKKRVINTIRKLADGIPLNNDKLSKPVQSHTNLFESRYTDGSRILFEVAIQFSPRLTKQLQPGMYMYSEVIRLWDIVRDHDNLSRHINHVDQAIKSIEKSQSRGKQAAIQTPLKSKQCTQGQERIRLPQYYFCNKEAENEKQEEGISFLPAGSTRDNEYNVITFYSFDSSFVRSMLSGDGARRDFPFKEWPKEHDIINMPVGDGSILLLGRSGTGKTTCCLYRLWNQFQAYWSNVSISKEPLILHKPLQILHKKEVSMEESNAMSEVEESVEDDSSLPKSQPLEHFHQVFITKNYVLCAQMKKRFYDLAAARDLAKDHMKFEDADTPTNLSDVNDLAYPLFLTARQFFILLDNSLQEGKNFFERDSDGKLAVKILSTDYDHENPDTLLDLEESDSEGEIDDFDDNFMETKPISVKKRQLQTKREITASYFVENIWPKISNGVTLHDTKLDPLLVWMEIKSFIKGSMSAVEKEGGYLSQREYEELGRKMAPNYEDRRQDIYKLFHLYRDYVRHKSEDNVFDECDLNHNLFTRLNDLKDLPWSIHSIYVDEVQDFTQAELSILIRICRNPNDLFLTGDTAQSIMRGISFRFSDLRSIFHQASEQVSKSGKSVSVKVPKVNELTINFRSHTGILMLAASIIDLMKRFFPNSFDCLPGDEGMFPGPTPVVLDACHFSDLALVLRTNKRESSTIEFGAHQVIIVQSEEAKKNIPDVLKTGIVLTVFESKGLEFDDVLLYNFFKDSKIKEEWRVVTAFTEERLNTDQIVNHEDLFNMKPRKLNFNKSQHKSLNAELKYLYTAITRAKCNLWIYDSDEAKRLPVFDYWSKRGLVKVARISDIKKEDQSSIFSATSSKEEWQAQGDYFKKKRLWEPAMKCYQRAECPHLESEARAYSLAQQARTSHGLKRDEITEIYLKSAHGFLKCDQAEHNYSCLENAAICLKKAKRYNEASKLYICLKQIDKAIKTLHRTSNINYEVLAGLKDAVGKHNDAIRLLLKHSLILPALEYADKYRTKGISISKCYDVHTLAIKFADELSKSAKVKSHHEESMKQFKTVLEYLPIIVRVSYFKAAEMHEEACEILRSQGKHTELLRIYKAQAWHDKGMLLARKKKEREKEEGYILFKATVEMESDSRKISDTTLAMLKKKRGINTERENRVNLILAMGQQNYTIIMGTSRFFKKERNHIAYIEALHLALTHAKYDVSSQQWTNINLKPGENLFDLILTAQKDISTIKTILGGAKEYRPIQNHLIGQIESFYGLERDVIEEEPFFVYCIPSTSYPWTNTLLQRLISEDTKRDADGMLLFEMDSVLTEVCNHFDESFVRRWIANDELKILECFYKALDNHPLHQDMMGPRGGYLPKSYSAYSDRNLQEYLNMLCNAFDITAAARDWHTQTNHLVPHEHITSSDIITAMKNAISPQATCYLPMPFQILTVRSDLCTQMLIKESQKVLKESDDEFHLDRWLESWRINCVTKNGIQEMRRILEEKTDEYNATLKDIIPPVYVQDGQRRYHHVMLLWIKTCETLQDNRVLAFCTLFVHNIVRNIAAKEALWKNLSISNLLNLVTIQTTAILVMYAACNARLNNECTIYLPHSYRQVGTVFQNITTAKHTGFYDAKGRKFFEACIAAIKVKRFGELHLLPGKLLNMLRIIMKAMIGIQNEKFNPLRYALSNETCLENHEAWHCLVFVLALFSNIGLMSNCQDAQLQHFRRQIYNSVKHCQLPELKESCNQFATCPTIAGCFDATKRLLDTSGDNFESIRFTFFPKSRDIDFVFNEVKFLDTEGRQLWPITVEVSLSQLNPEAKPFTPNTIFFPPTLQSRKLAIATEIAAPEFEEETDLTVNVDHDEDVNFYLESLPNTTATSSSAATTTTKNPMVDDDFCRACACPLMPDSMQAVTRATSSLETYSDHCRSDSHSTNMKKYERFNIEMTDYYFPKKTTLEELLQKCKTLNSNLQNRKLQEMINTIEGMVKMCEKEVEDIVNSASWSEDLTVLRNACGQCDSLCMRAEGVIEEGEEQIMEIEKAKEQEEKREEEEEEDLMEEEEEEISQVAPNYGEMDQERKRRGKRRKHENRKLAQED